MDDIILIERLLRSPPSSLETALKHPWPTHKYKLFPLFTTAISFPNFIHPDVVLQKECLHEVQEQRKLTRTPHSISSIFKFVLHSCTSPRKRASPLKTKLYAIFQWIDEPEFHLYLVFVSSRSISPASGGAFVRIVGSYVSCTGCSTWANPYEGPQYSSSIGLFQIT